MKSADLEKAIERNIRAFGLKNGDIVFVSANLSMLSIQTMQDVSKTLEVVLERILGKDGTILVQTYTTYVARYGKPFIYETSKCINGAFSQRILEKKESVRSLHPVNSFAAIGRHSEYLCKDNTCNNYGIGSPLDRLLSLNGKVLRLGIPIGSSPLMHYVESIFGVPYNYNKLIDAKVFKNNIQLNKTFCANVRYLNLDFGYNGDKLNKIFSKKFQNKYTTFFGVDCSLISSKKIVNTYMELLLNDVWSFLIEKPKFEKGVVPFDGITESHDIS